MKHFLLAMTALVGVVVAQGSWAATATGAIAASATVSTVCAMSTTPLAFGEVALSGATTGATPGTATVNVTCTGGGGYSVALDSGLNNVAAQRNLKSGSNLLAYGLYTDLAHGTVWPVAPGVAGIGNAASQLMTVYGLIPAGQVVVSGNGTAYTDTVTVTLTY
jgi:spore coat protein U-like protein